MGRAKTRFHASVAMRATPQYPIELRAWKHIETQRQKIGPNGKPYTVSQIIVDALAARSGATPEMFSREGLDAQAVLLADTIKADMGEQLDDLKRDLLQEFGRLLLDELHSRQVISTAQHQALIAPAGDDGAFVDAMISGLASGGRLRKRGGA